MSASTSPDPVPVGNPPAAPSRTRGPKWVLVVLLLLLAGWFVVTQIVNRTGPRVDWIVNNFPRAEELARAQGRRIFLLLQEPNCPVTEANFRDLFSLRAARARLARMVCCRVTLSPSDPLARRFQFHKEPLMIVLEPGRDSPVVRPLAGKVDWLTFKTYVSPGPGEDGN